MSEAPKEPVSRPMKGSMPLPAWANPQAVVEQVETTMAPIPPAFAAQIEQPQFAAAPAPQMPPPPPAFLNVQAPVVEAPVQELAKQPVIETPVIENVAIESVIEIEDDIPLPAIKRKTAKESPYPFDLLQVGQSFFVPLTVKKMATNVNQAMKKHMVQDGTFSKNRKGVDVPTLVKTVVFEVRIAEKNGVAGCRIFRTA